VITGLVTTRVYEPDPAAAEELQRCGRAIFGIRRASATRLAVAVTGEIDAVNARALARFAECRTGISRQLMLDLRAVDFFGIDGFAALHYISVHCGRSDVDWAIVGGPPVRRVLSICDPEGELPMADDVPAALDRLDRFAQCRHSRTAAV
jgi:anti-anti-sigma factor